MKKLFLTIVTFSILFVIGCQENSITDPITVEPTNKVQQTDPSHKGTITLERMLTDPYPAMNSYYIVNGEIQYQHTVQLLDPIPPNPQYVVSLNLSVTAGLTYLCTVCGDNNDEGFDGYIETETDDTFLLPENGIFYLVKTFSIQGRDDDMVLKCRFLVTMDSVELNEMWLELPETNVVNNETD